MSSSPLPASCCRVKQTILRVRVAREQVRSCQPHESNDELLPHSHCLSALAHCGLGSPLHILPGAYHLFARCAVPASDAEHRATRRMRFQICRGGSLLHSPTSSALLCLMSLSSLGCQCADARSNRDRIAVVCVCVCVDRSLCAGALTQRRALPQWSVDRLETVYAPEEIRGLDHRFYDDPQTRTDALVCSRL
eukprot:386402-Rhodomonas_salina.1